MTGARSLLLMVLLTSCGKSDAGAAAGAGCSADQESANGECIARVPACSGRTVPSAGACVPVGLRADDCADGFSWDESNGVCRPILPTETCASGTMAVPGEKACRPVASCGADRYPKVTGDVAYVDAAAAAGGDGTADKPFTTISDALAKTTSDTIAVAAGHYEEVVTIERDRKVIGVCPEKVEITPPGGTPWTVAMQYGGTLSNVSVTGNAMGLSVCEGTIVVDHVWIHDTSPNRGIEVAVCPTPTDLQVKDTLIERAGKEGIIGTLGTATVTRSVVRDTTANGPNLGPGIWWQWDKRAKSPLSLTVQGSVVEGNRTAGIYTTSSSLLVDGSVVRNNRPTSGTYNGRSVLAGQSPGGPSEKIVVRRSMFSEATGEAISVGGSELELEAVTITGTKVTGFGGGSLILFEGAHGVATRVVIEQSAMPGVTIAGGSLTLKDSIVRDSRGIGVQSQPYLVYPPEKVFPTKLEIEHLLVDGAQRFAGMVIIGTDVRARGLLVRNVHPADGLYGDGVAATFFPGKDAIPLIPTSLDFEDVWIENAARAGIGLFGADLALHRSRMVCNAFEIDTESAGGLGSERSPNLVDNGDNGCGCGTLDTCRASSAALAPIGQP